MGWTMLPASPTAISPWSWRFAPHIPILSDQLVGGPSGVAFSSQLANCGCSRKRSKKSLRFRPVRASAAVETPAPTFAVRVHVLRDKDLQILPVRTIHAAEVLPASDSVLVGLHPCQG